MVAAIRASDSRYLAIGILIGAATAVLGVRLSNPVVLLLAPSVTSAFALGIVNPRHGRVSDEALICSSLFPSAIVLVDGLVGVILAAGPLRPFAAAFDVVLMPFGMFMLAGIPALFVGGAVNAVTARVVARLTDDQEVLLPDEKDIRNER